MILETKMATLHVRNIPDELYAQIQSFAAERNRSLSAEVVELLQNALEQEKIRRKQGKLLADIRRRRLAYKPKQRVFDSVKMLREDRDR